MSRRPNVFRIACKSKSFSNRSKWLVSEPFELFDVIFGDHDEFTFTDGQSLPLNDFDADITVALDEWIGVKDIKGVAIFENDIVRIKCPGGGDFENTVGAVYWPEMNQRFVHGNNEGRPGKCLWEYATVIGNVYHDAKLIKSSR